MAVERGEKVTAILQAAAQAFAEKGYHQTTIKDIARRANIAAGTYYLYFPNKEESCLAIIRELHEEVIHEVVESRRGTTHPLRKLIVSMQAALHVFQSRPLHVKIAMIQAPGADPRFDELLLTIHEELAHLVRRDLDEGVTDGIIPPVDTDVISRAMIGGMYEVVIGVMRNEGMEALQHIVEPLVHFYLRALGASPEDFETEDVKP